MCDEGFVGSWGSVAGGARFERAHVAGVQRGGHLEDEADKIVGHSHLHHGGPDLIVGCVNVSEIGFTDSLADDGGSFVVVEIALALQFLRGFAAEGEAQESVGGSGSDVASGDKLKFEIGANRPDGGAHHANGASLTKSVFHEVSGTQMKHVRGIDLVEFLFKIVEADYGAGAGGFVGAEAAERNNISDSGFLSGGDDGVADPLRITESVIAGGVGWNHDIGGFNLLEGLGKCRSVGDIGDENLRALRRERLQVSGVSADGTNFLTAGEKGLSHNVAGVAACSKNNVHGGTSFSKLDAGRRVWTRHGRAGEAFDMS